MEAFKAWRHYLEGPQHQVAVLTDHNNLRWFLDTKALTRRQAHWAEFLSGFNFRIDYRAGKRNPADAPSRRADYKPDEPFSLVPFFKLAHLTLALVREAGVAECEDLCLGEAIVESHNEADEPERFSTTLLDDIRTALRKDVELHEAAKQSPDWYVWKDDLLYCDGTRLYAPEEVRLRIMKGFHDSVVAGHHGRDKTLATLRKWFYWPKMDAYVAEYIRTCSTCARTKSTNHLPHGELMPLPAPTRAWSDVTIDFVTDLPLSSTYKGKDKYDCIFVVVDRLTKMAHYSPCSKNMDAIQFAYLFLRVVFAGHGMPERIFSDRGTLFTSHFWRVLSKRLGADHRFSTAFHPQTDGQTERQNQTLEQYLRCFVNFMQDDWVDHLPLAEYSYNISHHSVVDTSPFRANYGREPVPLALYPYQGKAQSANADEVARDITALQDNLMQRISEAQDQQARYYDQGHKRVFFKVGDKVMLRTTNLKTERPSRKLSPKLLGPFKVLRQISSQAYRLDLPKSFKVHPVFHVTLLEPHHPNTLEGRTEPPPTPVGEVTEGVDNRRYEVKEIVKSKRVRGKLRYYVWWEGYEGDPDEYTWQSPEDVDTAAEKVREFHEKYPDMPGPEA